MIRSVNKTGVSLLLLLLAGAVITTWLRTRPDSESPLGDPEARPQIDFFMENFRIRQYDDRGQLHYILQGMQLNHYESERAEIRNPDLVLQRQNRQWTVRADQAVTADNAADEIRFLGNVRIEQPDALLIRTESLLLQPQSDYMETLAPVIITGSGSTIEAAALHTDLKTGMYTLTAVRGSYVP
ncbi:MAG TPA: LPS export ABC transporter periplasmic protein LptC [Gammaproteobacteria bacterium]